MLTIRFSRTGKKKQPQYRIIISEKHKDPWGDYLELLGNYNPHTKEVTLKKDRIKHWLSVGAQTSNSVFNLLLREGLVTGGKKKSVSISGKRAAKKTAKEKETLKTSPAAEKKEVLTAKTEVKPEATAATLPAEKELPEEKPQPAEAKKELTEK